MIKLIYKTDRKRRILKRILMSQMKMINMIYMKILVPPCVLKMLAEIYLMAVSDLISIT